MIDIKKTDIFSGIGVFLIQIVENIICYALQKNKVYLFWGIIFAFIISVSIVIFEETEKFGRSVYEGYGRRPRISISRELIERGIYRNKKEFSLF